LDFSNWKSKDSNSFFIEFVEHLKEMDDNDSGHSENGRVSKAVKQSLIEDNAGFVQVENQTDLVINLEGKLNRNAILFCFCIDGEAQFISKIQKLPLSIDVSEYLMLTYPYNKWNLHIKLNTKSTLLLLLVTVEKLHEFFNKKLVTEGSGMEAVLKDYKLKKFYTRRRITPSISINIRQVFNNNLNESFQKLYHKSKILEFISFYLDGTEHKDYEQDCPFLNDNTEMEKIKKVKSIITENMLNPPSLTELAREVGTNEFKLKIGFKKVYGNTVFGYLNDHRMNIAREMLELKKHRIKEIAYNVGYTNPSHFIASFKKKYGVTPKKYLLSL